MWYAINCGGKVLCTIHSKHHHAKYNGAVTDLRVVSTLWSPPEIGRKIR